MVFPQNEYETQAEDFCKKYKVKMQFIGKPVYRKYFSDDKESRYVFKIRLLRNGLSYTFNFGQSINGGSQRPTKYDVLACLSKYNPGDFEDFCSEYGYDVYNDGCTYEKYDGSINKESMKIYNAVVKEYKAVERLFGDVLEELEEIC